MKKCRIIILAAVMLLLGAFSSMPVSAATVKLNTSKKTLTIKQQFQLSVKGTSEKATWSSSNPKVAKVKASTGLVTARSKGTAVITAKIGTKKYTCKIQVKQAVDVIIFAGQSNMTGNGDAAQAPALTEGAGYAFNYVTSRNKLEALKEPFGYGQDDSYFYNGDYARGSMVTAFVNAYYKKTQTPVIAVPAASVGTGSVSWKESRYKGVNARAKAAIALAKKEGFSVRHVYLVWMQGENDAFALASGGITAKEHAANLQAIYKKIKKGCGAEACMVISLPSYYNDKKIAAAYQKIRAAQTSLCKTDSSFVMVSTLASDLSSSYLREDGLHLTQQALNKIGTQAGSNAGKYAVSH